MTLRLSYRALKLRALCWVLRRLRAGQRQCVTLKLPLTMQLFVFRGDYYDSQAETNATSMRPGAAVPGGPAVDLFGTGRI